MGKVKASLLLLLLALSPRLAFAEGDMVATLSNLEDYYLVGDPVPGGVTVQLSKKNQSGFLEGADMAIGSLLSSHHFSKDSDYDYNETHNGVYININNWSLGTYRNSADVQSTVATYNSRLYENKLFKMNLVTGLANGYEGWENAQGDYLLVLGVSAQLGYLKTVLLPDAIALGVEIPLN